MNGAHRRRRTFADDPGPRAGAGAAAALLDLDAGAAEKLIEDRRAEGAQALAIGCDVADEARVKAAVEKTVAEFGRLDMACTNAGVQASPGELQDQPSAEFDRVAAINRRSLWPSLKDELARMRAQGSGAIVDCASIDTPMVEVMMKNQPENRESIMQRQAIRRLGEAERVANAGLRLASPAASFVRGATLPVDGGFAA